MYPVKPGLGKWPDLSGPKLGNFRIGDVGESLTTLEKHNTPLETATTSSHEALKAYSTAMRWPVLQRYSAGHLSLFPTGFVPNGYLLEPLNAYTPLGFSGAISFDGKGHLTGWDTVSMGGMAVPRTYAGTYQVASDCSFTSDFTDSLIHHLHTANYIYRAGKAIATVNTDPGLVLAFNGIRE